MIADFSGLGKFSNPGWSDPHFWYADCFTCTLKANARTDKKEYVMQPIRTILHPTDFSESSDYAFNLACWLAQAHGARVHVLHVGKGPMIDPVGGFVPPEPDSYQEHLSKKLHEMRLTAPNIPVESQLRFAGNAAAEIVRIAQAIKSDLIVMGTHGRTGLGRLLMGSVAEQVVRKASCPVVTVKTPLPETAASREPSSEAADNTELIRRE
jgi:nucleotide-binding universal stress UspA family protein